MTSLMAFAGDCFVKSRADVRVKWAVMEKRDEGGKENERLQKGDPPLRSKGGPLDLQTEVSVSY